MSHGIIGKEEVLRVAHLARLDLSDAEVQRARQDLDHVLNHIDTLNTADVQDVAPTAHPVALALNMRPDTIVQSLSIEAALSNAPERLGDGFGVPKILD